MRWTACPRAARSIRRLAARMASLLAMVACTSMGEARADEKLQCVTASEEAQQLRNAGKLSEARERLSVCNRAECPKVVQQDCAEWMREVLEMLPTVVPAAKDRSGRDLVDVTVSIDGKVVTSSLDGKALDLDPGVHVFRFETKNAPPVEEQVVVRQGEKNRMVTVTLDPAAEPPATEPSPERTTRSAPIAAFVAGGAGVLLLGAALYVGLDASADARELRSTCAPHCQQSQVDDVEGRYVIAGVTGGIGAAALIAGAILFFTHRSGAKGAARSGALSSLPIRGAASPQGGVALLELGFR
jgi:hypothetical protein